jgi:hypothetical protein
MKPLGDRTRGRDSARHRRCGAALVILVAAVSLGTHPARSGDAVQDVQPSAIAGLVRSRITTDRRVEISIDYRLIDRRERHTEKAT